jgi:hypothetical protein
MFWGNWSYAPRTRKRKTDVESGKFSNRLSLGFFNISIYHRNFDDEDLFMTTMDIIIIIGIAILVSLVVYFNFIKNKNTPCHGCSKARTCHLTCDEIKKQLREEYEK